MEQVVRVVKYRYIRWWGDAEAKLQPITVADFNVEKDFNSTEEALEHVLKNEKIKFEYIGGKDV